MNRIFSEYLDKIENALENALPEVPDQNWIKSSFSNLSEYAKQEHFSPLINPCKALLSSGGKRWRPLLLILCSNLARENGKSCLSLEQTYSLTPLIEFVHTASLIHDDIEDNADTRRGKPSVHITHGTDTAINSASWLYFQAATVINNPDFSPDFSLRLYKLYTQELRRLHLGQAMDILWHRNPSIIPTVEEYSQMVQCKTGTLASLAVQTGLISGGATSKEALEGGKIAGMLGEAFQILDDVKNLTSGNPGKKRGDDIVERKKSLPVLLHIKENPSDAKIISSLMTKASNEGIDSPAVEECINLLNSKGAVTKAYNIGLKSISENSQKLSVLFQKETKSSTLILELFSQMAK
ncbi:MAG: polyprenyl synthetase family protein [Treponema sp.]